MKIADLDLNTKGNDGSSPKDRIPIINEAFELVLNRKPSSRELSFYKYGNQEREEIIEKLLEDEEHKEALKKTKEFPELEKRVKDAEHKVVQLKQKLKDSKEEIDQVKDLLAEKNKEIAILRREKDDPYNFTHADALKYIRKLTENKRTETNTVSQIHQENDHFSTVTLSERDRKRTFWDKIYDLIRSR
jgi:chromosome segregation ATPase